MAARVFHFAKEPFAVIFGGDAGLDGRVAEEHDIIGRVPGGAPGGGQHHQKAAEHGR